MNTIATTTDTQLSPQELAVITLMEEILAEAEEQLQFLSA